jgi:hypothetical protein
VISATFRPVDEGVCVWTEGDEPDVLCLTIDVEAPSFEEALRLGRAELR